MPTGYIPTFKIVKGNEDVTARFQDRALSITVELSSGSGDQDHCEIVLDDREFQIATPRVKDRLDIYLGYDGVGLSYMGTFEINSVMFALPPRTIAVRGTAASSLNDLKSQKIEAFEGKTIEQILAESGSKIGMKVDVHPTIADKKIPYLNSTTSFADLIGRLEQQYSATAKINDGRLSLVPRGAGKSVSDFSMPTLVFGPSSFASLEVLTESRGETARTKASYRDKDTHKREFVESKSKLSSLDTEAEHLIGSIFNSKEEAQAAADAAQGQLDRSTGKISASLAEGDPWVRDQQRIVVSGIRDGIDGSYLVDICRHTYSKQGALRTSFTGAAGIDGLAAEYAASTSNAPDPITGIPSFVVVGPGQVAGQVLPQAFSNIPALVGAPLPTTSN